MARKGENIYKRKDGRWEARLIAYYDDAGKAHYRSLYAKSYNEVREKKKELLKTGAAEPEKRERRGEKILFSDLCDQWLFFTKSSIKESSYARYRDIVECHVKPWFYGMCAEQVCELDFERFFQALLSGNANGRTGLSPKTIADIKSVARRIVKYGMRRSMMQSVNLDDLQTKGGMNRIRVLTVEEQRRLERCLLSEENRIYACIYLAVYTGIRIGELCAMRISDLDTDRGTLRVNKTMERIRNFNDDALKKTKIVIETPKSACSIRTIPVPAYVCSILAPYCGEPKDAFLTTGDPHKYMEPRTMANRLQAIMNLCDIQDATFHCLRHSFATRCVEADFDIKSLSEILGHANVNITLNRYVHPSAHLKRQNMDKLKPLFAVR